MEHFSKILEDFVATQIHYSCSILISPVSGLSSPVNPLGQLNKDVEEDDVFMPLELPLVLDSGSGTGSSPASPAPPSRPDNVSSSEVRVATKILRRLQRAVGQKMGNAGTVSPIA